MRAVKIWLDDVRPAPAGWHWVQTAHDCIDALLTWNCDEISLDHDLGDDAKYGTGYDVILWMERAAADELLRHHVPRNINIHSANPVGVAKMEAGLHSIVRFLNKW